jgi:glycosyltransferase involved in cell wall biosynthesis
VVSTRSGGPDGIISQGVDGYLVDRGSAEDLAEALRQVISDPRAALAMGAAGRAKVEALYSDQAAGARYLEVYDHLLRSPAP